ncbi:hypothetical protein FNF31_05023 [Cafeteria roenbergensis]|uniref:Sialidase domain-containing protein n=1 Tax=Cafeteria roenbergensis TaxID=33653 RepID=A0A5A8CZS6_CAFRO|nr:hypothetical protein FNF28_06247 [Cafeteria roenbergensis]KAA0159071.1 hypothetical protein FNF31_05023 [Cafeteria roenbergensis]
MPPTRIVLGMSAVMLCARGALALDPVLVPAWSGPIPDPSKPLAGLKQVPGFEATRVYKATPALGTYNHAAMILLHDDQLLVTWKNGVRDEDSPGQRVMYSQSTDGVTWTPSDGSNIMFPNMSTAANPAHLFAGPPIVLNGRVYASASPKQFCLFPDQYQNQLLLRRVYTNTTMLLGSPFWAASTIPAGFEEASKLRGVVTSNMMDSQTIADVALLTANATDPPCAASLQKDHSNKCEACRGACQDWDATLWLNLANERTHYVTPQGVDVMLYRSRERLLFASTRQGGAAGDWSKIVKSGIPDINSNINAGTLPDGRTFLVSNAVPGAKIRDPLTIATSKDGTTFGDAAVAISCTELKPGGSSSDPCLPAYAGGAKEPGPSYPQAAVIQGWPGAKDGLYFVVTNNKEDVWVVRLPLANF